MQFKVARPILDMRSWKSFNLYCGGPLVKDAGMDDIVKFAPHLNRDAIALLAPRAYVSLELPYEEEQAFRVFLIFFSLED